MWSPDQTGGCTPGCHGFVQLKQSNHTKTRNGANHGDFVKFENTEEPLILVAYSFLSAEYNLSVNLC